MRETRPWCLFVALLLASGCGGGGSTPFEPHDPTLVVGLITIDSVEVIVTGPAPAQVAAHVRGVLGDGCTSLRGIEQRRLGNTVEVQITSQRPQRAICTQIAQIIDQTIALDGRFPAGAYTLKVNSVTQGFQVD